VPTFSFVSDLQGANDEPGQKDLTADAAAFDSGTGDFYTAWKWDDTSWSGNNTGDACSLFDTDADGKANYAVCVTIGKPASEKSTRLYSCLDTRADRCTGSTLVGTESATQDWCSVANAPGAFTGGGTDTQATCNITHVATDTGTIGLDNGTLIDSCSYPSQQPNSDPSDCVHQVASVTVAVSTLSSGSATWTATLSDSATLSPSTATGSVVFKLYTDNLCSAANLIWTSAADTTAPFTAGSGGTPTDGNIVTGSGQTTYYWIASYTPTGAFVADDSACGEATVINATVVGASGS
jgi:hypothetical protein